MLMYGLPPPPGSTLPEPLSEIQDAYAHHWFTGPDIAKNVFQVYGVDRGGRSVIQRKLRRTEVLKFFSKLGPSLIGIEACHGSHFWARELTSLGLTVRLLPTQYVKPFVVGGKNDANDASAICAAVSDLAFSLYRSKALNSNHCSQFIACVYICNPNLPAVEQIIWQTGQGHV